MLQQFYPDHEADSAYGIDYKTPAPPNRPILPPF